MVGFIVYWIIMFVVLVWSRLNWGQYNSTPFEFYIKAILHSALITMVGWFIISVAVPEIRIDTEVREKTYPLLALQGNAMQEAHGEFFLGIGSINQTTEVYYHYLIETKDGAKMQKLSPEYDNVYIKEINGDSAQLVVKTIWSRRVVVNERDDHWFFHVHRGKWQKMFNSEKYILEVPKGTILKEYNVNLKY